MLENSTAFFWNLLLSCVSGVILWWVRGVTGNIDDLRANLSKTREQLAREYALKEDVENDINKILSRFDRLEIKLDKFMENVVKNIHH
jgi:hypothetical protein